MSKVFEEIQAERTYQTLKWGTAMDDRNTPYNWAAYIGQYSTRNLVGDPAAVGAAKFRADMVKVAAMAVAAIEAIDRAAA